MRVPRLLLWMALMVGLGACTATEPPVLPTVTSSPVTTPTIAPSPTLVATPGAGAIRTDSFGIEQVWVPPGTFMMGSDEPPTEAVPSWGTPDDEQPAHEVTLSQGFWMDRTEVTMAAYAQFVEAGGYTTPALWSEEGQAWLAKLRSPGPQTCLTDAQPDYPQLCLSFYEAEAYARWRGGRLPTEAEWEWAARGPEGLRYPWGNVYDPTRANLEGRTGPLPVGSFPEGASWVGALDMTGNAMEWVQDWYAPYPADAVRDPLADEPQSEAAPKVKRGGWWGAPAYAGRTTFRHSEDGPAYRDDHIGARIVVP